MYHLLRLRTMELMVVRSNPVRVAIYYILHMRYTTFEDLGISCLFILKYLESVCTSGAASSLWPSFRIPDTSPDSSSGSDACVRRRDAATRTSCCRRRTWRRTRTAQSIRRPRKRFGQWWNFLISSNLFYMREMHLYPIFCRYVCSENLLLFCCIGCSAKSTT
jgi:hypothetical protein